MTRLILLVAGMAALAIACAPSAPAKPTPTVPLSQAKLAGTPALAFDKKDLERKIRDLVTADFKAAYQIRGKQERVGKLGQIIRPLAHAGGHRHDN